MQIDLRNAELPAEALRAEVCIVGAGIAGLTLAHKLAGQGTDVLLLEAGSLTPEPGALRAEAAPVIYPNTARPQPAGRIDMPGLLHPGSAAPAWEAFGGTSLTWGGQLLPLPERKAPDTAASLKSTSSWPVSPEELAPYMSEVERILGVDDLPYESPAFFYTLRTSAPSLFAGIPDTTLRVSKFAPFSHRNLAQTLGKDVLSHGKVRVFTHARAIELLLKPSCQDGPDQIEAMLVAQPNGRAFRIEANEFILSAGTLETVRLLLASRSVQARGVGNAQDQLGRNLHDHLTMTAAVFTGASRELVVQQLRPWMISRAQRTTVHSLKLEASPTLREQLGLHPVMAHLTVEEPEDSPLGSLRAVLRERQEQGRATALRREARQLAPALGEAARLLWSAAIHKRRYVSRHAEVALRLNCAQRTPSNSRLTLSDDLDEAGRPKLVLHWTINTDECLTLVRFAAHVRRYLDETAMNASARWTPALFPPFEQPANELVSQLIPELTDARHLMGGALMGTDPRSSVVDPELRVHGTANLHIASLAVFPDGSAQLPTLTLMALSLRLADRLIKTLRA